VVALQPLHPEHAPDGDEAADAAHALSRLADLVSLRLEAQRRRATAVPLGRVVYALVPLQLSPSAPARVADTAALRRLVEQIVADARQALRLQVRGAIGPSVPSLADAARSRREADLVLTVLDPRAGDPLVATAESLRHRVVLAELTALTEDHPWLFTGPAQQIAAYDEEKQTQYGATLAAFLDCFGDSVAAAERVGVHPNTLRYRLRRIREIFDVDLDDADTRLVLALQDRLRRG
jgi:DNA-binding PucR family transcriptional regulator